MRLINDYSEVIRIYADLIEEMRNLVGLGLESEVTLIRRTCRTTWEAVEQARIGLYRHEADHNCSRCQFLNVKWSDG